MHQHTTDPCKTPPPMPPASKPPALLRMREKVGHWQVGGFKRKLVFENCDIKEMK